MQKARDWYKNEDETYDEICFSLCQRYSGQNIEYYCDKYKTTIKKSGPISHTDLLIMGWCMCFEKDKRTTGEDNYRRGHLLLREKHEIANSISRQNNTPPEPNRFPGVPYCSPGPVIQASPPRRPRRNALGVFEDHELALLCRPPFTPPRGR